MSFFSSYPAQVRIQIYSTDFLKIGFFMEPIFYSSHGSPFLLK